MKRCIRCGSEFFSGKRICPSCMKKWTGMRTAIFTILQEKYGTLSISNHPIFIKETKRLEKIWKKNPKQFQEELTILKG